MHTNTHRGDDALQRFGGKLTPELVVSILDSAPDAMVIVDAAGVIQFANRQVTSLFGYAPDELTGRSVESLMQERFRERHAEHRRQFDLDPRARPMGHGLELQAMRKNGIEFPVEISLSPIVDGARTLIVAAIRDVTERQATQRELRQAREDAERANRAKSRFLATASHDLRQPLQSLALLHGAMRRLSSDANLVEALDQGEQAIGAMSRLLNALLDIGKLESGAVQPVITDFRVAELLEELRAEFSGFAASKGLGLLIEPCSERVHSDAPLVGQVVRNLVSNAIKYTHAGQVSLRCRRAGPLVRFEVADTGIGIPDDELKRIYDDFYQVGVPRNASRDGYGLGLGIVARLVKLLGLTLEVRSEIGKGSVFALGIPASAATSEARDAAGRNFRRESPAHACRAHILLVEDDVGVRNATRMLFRVEGHDVSTAATLKEALQQAREHPDIALLVADYHLGGAETGLEVVSAVRGILEPNLKAILVTGDTSASTRALARDAHLRAASKPVNAGELLALVSELLEQ